MRRVCGCCTSTDHLQVNQAQLIKKCLWCWCRICLTPWTVCRQIIGLTIRDIVVYWMTTLDPLHREQASERHNYIMCLFSKSACKIPLMNWSMDVIQTCKKKDFPYLQCASHMECVGNLATASALKLHLLIFLPLGAGEHNTENCNKEILWHFKMC